MTAPTHPRKTADSDPAVTEAERPVKARRQAGLFMQGLERAGQLMAFAGKGLAEVVPALRLYPSEVFRQAGILIQSSALVVMFTMFVFSFLFTLQVILPFVSAGIESYLGDAPALVSRGMIQIMFAWIFAAKVGCGIVAELGAMRINDEIDATEVMGIRPTTYLVGTRVAAAIIVVPLLWCVALGVAYVASYLVAVPLTSTTSHGQFLYILFLFQNAFDFLVWVLWAFLYGVVIVLVACYFGFTASGGPVGVGRNTAWSMLVNIVLISVLAMVLNQVFYANNPNMPLGN